MILNTQITEVHGEHLRWDQTEPSSDGGGRWVTVTFLTLQPDSFRESRLPQGQGKQRKGMAGLLDKDRVGKYFK